ncbi:MAG: putative glycolipid-binding domain-containing protein [Thermoanaerobaculia bacterium]
MVHTILWRRLDRPGHESAALFRAGSEWRLEGSAVFSHAREACRLDYRLRCDASWRTLSGEVSGWLAGKPIAISITADGNGRWTLDGREAPDVAGCIDLDLNFSPSTNLLPVRRLELPVGVEAAVRAAWLKFPSFTLEPLEQTYRRTGERSYGYESAGGRFRADLRVDAQGFPLDYAGVWRAEEGIGDTPDGRRRGSSTG